MTKEVKCIVWDLDETLWNGTLLESDDVRLKPSIAAIIDTLDQRGILHSISSKNNFDDAMAKLRQFGIDHYFLYPEINWNAKSSSIAAIQKNLNIGMDSLLFIDDQAFERDEVKSVHPDIRCLAAEAYDTLPDLPACNPKFITQDSAKRREMYQNDITRNHAEKAYSGPQEAFLAHAEMVFSIAHAKEEDLKRAEELTVRTNQLNATGKTYDYDELNHFRTAPNYTLLVCELSDKYGTYGKIGLALIEITPEAWYLRLLLMSCRVMSRGVGTVLLSYIMQQAKQAEKPLLADFKSTDRNRMMYLTYRFANFKEIENDGNGTVLLRNDLEMIQKFPPYIEVHVP